MRLGRASARGRPDCRSRAPVRQAFRWTILPFGLTLGARGPIIAALAADLYRGRSFGAVLGLITLGNRLGSAVGPWLGGVIYDLTGSYRDAFTVAIAALVLAALALIRAGRPAPGDG
ncbi:MAG: MFS transporter [Candidatus Rokuibacteriota bacterium]